MIPDEIYFVVQDVARVEDLIAIADRLHPTSFGNTQSEGYEIVRIAQQALRQLEREAIRRLRDLSKGVQL